MAATIRLATADDAEAILVIYSPSILETPASFEMEVPSVAEMQRRITNVLAAYPWLVYEDESRVLGYAYASRHSARAAYEWSVDTSVYVHRDSHRRGVGRALYTSLLNLLRLQGYYNAYGGITLPNEGSVGLHKAMGYQLVGVFENVGYKFDSWHPVSYWSLQLQPLVANPPPPQPPSELVSTPAWQQALASGWAR
ncbi:MAG TPA: arsinothricin resistance N-acetyltransferase ArsN1 family B [Dehalococcoidia bacterium]|nr:arsinothricin resistance N-acetyltransferase ArsN1 family B [Dehalococcoidia bacterium]